MSEIMSDKTQIMSEIMPDKSKIMSEIMPDNTLIMSEILPDETCQLMSGKALHPFLKKNSSNPETNFVLSACRLRETFPSSSIFTHIWPLAL